MGLVLSNISEGDRDMGSGLAVTPGCECRDLDRLQSCLWDNLMRFKTKGKEE